ncbi:MAG: hypothetical protein P8168_03295 [Deltaproteobacteria bacterium]
MRQAGPEYLQEEARYRGARPRVKAVLFPFDLDYGLAPGSGNFVQTVYGGEPGKLAMDEGYFTSGSWTSPVVQAFSPYLDEAVTSWETPAGHMDVEIGFRNGATPDAVAQAVFVSLSRGQDISLAPYFQIKVDFQETVRAWALDEVGEVDNFSAYAVDQAPDEGFESYASDGPGCLTGFSLAGRFSLPEQEIIDPGSLQVELARDFSELRAADHALVLDNRLGQWLNRPGNAYLQGLDLTQKQLVLYHGWELADGAVAWQLLYQGVVQRLAGMAHGWSQQHRVRLESQDGVAAKLKQVVGAPADTGERRPFMRGTYLAQGELIQVIEAATSEIVFTGSGSARLNLLGTYRGDYSRNYVLEVDTAGEVGSATFRWSHDQGQSWQKANLVTGGPDAPMQLEDGLSVYWESGVGQDLGLGDRWSFTAIPPVYCYQVFGAPFQDLTAIYLDGEIDDDRVTAAADTGLIQVSGKNAQVQVRVVKDHTTHPVDIVTDILAEVGLSPAIHQDSFALAKSLTPEYTIGIRFENVTAAQAIREIVRRCLYDLWIGFGEIKLSAYLGESS